MKTRTKKPTKTTVSEVGKGDSTSIPSIQLQDSIVDPPRLTILPKGLSEDARIISCPRITISKQVCRYVICPDRGCFEFTTVGDPGECQSWLMTPTHRDGDCLDENDNSNQEEAYVLRDPYLLVATPVDPIFIVLPMMVAADIHCSGMYRTMTDIIYDDATEEWRDLRQLLSQERYKNVLQCLEKRVPLVSDTLQLGDDEDATYRLSHQKLATYILQRAIKTADKSFPSSLEQRFVLEALELPVHDIVASESTSPDPVAVTATVAASEAATQETTSSAVTSDGASTPATSLSEMPQSSSTASEQIQRLLRIRTTFNFMLRSYIPKSIHQQLNSALTSIQHIIDFQPLIDLEKRIASKRSEVQALRALSDNISRKRKLDDEEAADKAEEKRRKKEEEEAKKKSMSHGVKKLMKADTSGMKKLSAFFVKKPAA